MSVIDQPYASGSPPDRGDSVTVSPPATAVQPGVAVPPQTSLPRRNAQRAAPPARRQLSPIHVVDVLAVIGAVAGAAATTALLWFELSPFTGIFGYIAVSWGLFVLYYAVLVSFDQQRTGVRARIAGAIVWSVAIFVGAALVFIAVYTLWDGRRALGHLNFYTQDMSSTTQFDPLTKGGVLHAIAGTLIEVVIAMAIAVPLGLLAAVFISEVPGRLSRLVRTVVDAMTALPDILAGLFIYATLILIFGLGLSGLAAGCALAVTTLSIVCRAGYVVLRLVPGGLTEASYALGSGHWRTVWHVTLPTARSGLATAVILGTARAIGETSPVLLTAGATFDLNLNPVSGPMMSLPLAAYTLVANPEPNYIARGFGSAFVLLVIVVLLFVIMRVIGGRGAGQLSAGQMRRRLAGSRRDLARFAGRAAAAQATTVAMGAKPADAPSRWLLPGKWRPGRRP